MDPLLASGLGLSQPVPLPDSRSYSDDLPLPQFYLRHKADPNELTSLLPGDLSGALEELGQRIRGNNADPELYRDLEATLDPLRGVFPESPLKFTREYRDFQVLDRELGFVRPESTILLYTPRARQYFVDRRCRLAVVLCNSSTTQTASSIRLTQPEPEINTPDDTFYVNAVSERLVDNPVFSLQDFTEIPELQDRWHEIDQAFSKKKLVDLAVLDQDTWGRTRSGDFRNEDLRSQYDSFFWEPVFKTLSYLNDRGSLAIRLTALGFRASADLLYILKYVFGKLTLLKPATTSGVGQDHYAVFQDFRPPRFAEIEPKLSAFLEKMSKFAHSGVFELYSLVKNLPENANFLLWLIESYGQMAIWIASNLKRYDEALSDQQLGFQEHPAPVILDHQSIRNALDIGGRSISILTLPEHQADFPSQQPPADKPNNQEFYLDPAITPSLKWFFLVPTLNALAQKILDLPEAHDVLTIPGAAYGTKIITLADYYESRRRIGSNLKEWFGLLWSLGDLQKILENNSLALEVLSYRNWNAGDIFRVPLVKENSALKDLKASGVYGKLALLFQTWAQETQVLQNNPNAQQQVKLRIQALTNLRFRAVFSQGGVNVSLTKNGESPFGEYELLNLLTNGEVEDEQITPSVLAGLVGLPAFQTRVFEHAGLPALFSGFANELAVPDLYFQYQPDMECFASATNRHAPYWCSAHPADSVLGSLGSFFGPVSDPANPLFGTKVKSLMAFPPFHTLILTETIIRLAKIFKAQAAKKADFRVFLIYLDTLDNNDLVAKVIQEQMINVEHLKTKKLDKAYNPFSGFPADKIALKLVVLTSGTTSTII